MVEKEETHTVYLESRGIVKRRQFRVGTTFPMLCQMFQQTFSHLDKETKLYYTYYEGNQLIHVEDNIDIAEMKDVILKTGSIPKIIVSEGEIQPN